MFVFGLKKLYQKKSEGLVSEIFAPESGKLYEADVDIEPRTSLGCMDDFLKLT